jgi:hypothetical protein
MDTGQGPRAKGQGQRAKGQGRRAKGEGPGGSDAAGVGPGACYWPPSAQCAVRLCAGAGTKAPIGEERVACDISKQQVELSNAQQVKCGVWGVAGWCLEPGDAWRVMRDAIED